MCHAYNSIDRIFKIRSMVKNSVVHFVCGVVEHYSFTKQPVAVDELNYAD